MDGAGALGGAPGAANESPKIDRHRHRRTAAPCRESSVPALEGHRSAGRAKALRGKISTGGPPRACRGSGRSVRAAPCLRCAIVTIIARARARVTSRRRGSAAVSVPLAMIATPGNSASAATSPTSTGGYATTRQGPSGNFSRRARRAERPTIERSPTKGRRAPHPRRPRIAAFDDPSSQKTGSGEAEQPRPHREYRRTHARARATSRRGTRERGCAGEARSSRLICALATFVNFGRFARALLLSQQMSASLRTASASTVAARSLSAAGGDAARHRGRSFSSARREPLKARRASRSRGAASRSRASARRGRSVAVDFALARIDASAKGRLGARPRRSGGRRSSSRGIDVQMPDLLSRTARLARSGLHAVGPSPSGRAASGERSRRFGPADNGRPERGPGQANPLPDLVKAMHSVVLLDDAPPRRRVSAERRRPGSTHRHKCVKPPGDGVASMCKVSRRGKPQAAWMLLTAIFRAAILRRVESHLWPSTRPRIRCAPRGGRHEDVLRGRPPVKKPKPLSGRCKNFTDTVGTLVGPSLECDVPCKRAHRVCSRSTVVDVSVDSERPHGSASAARPDCPAKRSYLHIRPLLPGSQGVLVDFTREHRIRPARRGEGLATGRDREVRNERPQRVGIGNLAAVIVEPAAFALRPSQPASTYFTSRGQGRYLVSARPSCSTCMDGQAGCRGR